MKRVPINHPKVAGMRLCSMPGGRWQVQHMTEARGTRERDCWEGVRSATDFVTASVQLCSFIPVSTQQ